MHRRADATRVNGRSPTSPSRSGCSAGVCGPADDVSVTDAALQALESIPPNERFFRWAH